MGSSGWAATEDCHTNPKRQRGPFAATPRSRFGLVLLRPFKLLALSHSKGLIKNESLVIRPVLGFGCVLPEAAVEQTDAHVMGAARELVRGARLDAGCEPGVQQLGPGAPKRHRRPALEIAGLLGIDEARNPV